MLKFNIILTAFIFSIIFLFIGCTPQKHESQTPAVSEEISQNQAFSPESLNKEDLLKIAQLLSQLDAGRAQTQSTPENDAAVPPIEPDDQTLPENSQPHATDYTSQKSEPQEKPETVTETAEPEIPVDETVEVKIETQTKSPDETSKPETEKATEPETGVNSFLSNLQPIFDEFVVNGKVDYNRLSRRRLHLIHTLYEFETLDPQIYETWSREDKMAFWLNAYNLHLMNIIAQNYPIESTRILRLFWPPDSIRHISGLWDEYKFIIMDEEFTLNSLDNKYFKTEFEEPKLVFGISNGTVSSPPLRKEPYYGNKLYSQLEDQIEKFIKTSDAIVIKRNENTVYLNAIFQSNWYGKKFLRKHSLDRKFKDHTETQRAVLNFLIEYLPRTEVEYLQTGNYQIKYIPYNWSVNAK